ncbi:exocyst complex component 3-like protein 4 [Myripristis murdjan]|uniref:exocyst complex component 3-like protein 4 n=1 Tax=Myripristis murdjan TaxID=586833 RepID=UPI001175CFA3|nr:exocyst complex component 3-like protein 4 [Myripristis murdjan]
MAGMMEGCGDTGGMNSVQGQEEDRVSVKSNGKTPKLGTLKRSFRKSIKRMGGKSPLSSNSKGSKARRKSDTGAPNHDSGHQHAPPSPSLSAGSLMVSPLKNINSLFQKKEEDGTKGSPSANKKSQTHSRTLSEPTAAFADTLFKRGASIRRSLGFNNKKDKEKTAKPEPLSTASEAPVEMKREEETVWEEIEESYTLPEIPDTPLSVMQINKLIEMEVLEEAHLNLLSLRQEFQREQEQCGQDPSPPDLAKQEKDLNLLYRELMGKVKTIVRNSNSLPSRNKALLVPVARIIQEEEKREGDPGGLLGPGGWREAWREAVAEGVQDKLASVHLNGKEQTPSWLTVHLGLLGKAIVEDLEGVKRELRWSYPPSFNVFSTYVRSYHQAVGQHLKKLQQQAMELRHLYALLDWINNSYQSERIMGSPSLRPEMESESAAPSLEDGFLDQLKDKYLQRVQEDVRASLERIVQLEDEGFWSQKKSPKKDEDDPPKKDEDERFLVSEIHMDIWTIVKSNATHSRKIDAHLEERVIRSCLEELKQFPMRFKLEFESRCSAAEVRPPLLTEYQITYINTFTALKEHMIQDYRDTCPAQVDQFSNQVDLLLGSLRQKLGEQYKNNIKPYLRRMMTRKWLTNDEDFRQLYSHTETLSQHLALLRPPCVQEFVNELHLHVVKEYVAQLMKNNYSCKNRKHEKAAEKIRVQLSRLGDLFENMNSTHEWLHPVGDDLSDIIGQKNKRDIKNHLRPLAEHFPDISKKHLGAVLYFRGLLRGRERQLILQRLTQLKRELGTRADQSRALFGNMEVAVNTDCLADLPFSCLSFLRPDN